MPRTTPGSGAILRPVFNSSYGVERIEVIQGGNDYSKADPPKIVIEGTQNPVVEGIFYPVITGVGTIRDVIIFNTGAGYYPVFSTTTASEVVVERGSFGSISTTHGLGVSSVFVGDYNIVEDNIYPSPIFQKAISNQNLHASPASNYIIITIPSSRY